MICAFLLLTGFVSFWLIQRSKQEHKAITENLERVMAETQREVFDTLIFKSIVKPLLGDSILTQVRTTNEAIEAVPALPQEALEQIQSVQGPHGTSNMRMSVNVNSDDVPESHGTKKTVTVFRSNEKSFNFSSSMNITHDVEGENIDLQSDTASKMLITGMRLIMGEMASIAGPNMKFTSDMSVEADTNLLKRKFSSKLTRTPGLIIAWKPAGKGKLKQPSGDKVTLRTSTFTKNYEANISGINWLIAKNLSSEGAFVLLMLVITALAFVLAYRSLVRQDKLNTMKNDLINNMSHELKTPVATVKVALEALGDRRVMQNEGVAHEYLGMATLELNRLELLLGKVLNSSMLDSRYALISKDDIELKALLTESLESVKMRAEKQGAGISLSLPDERVWVKGDAIHIQGIVLNLVDNAMKYAGPQPSIGVALVKNEQSAVISVSDNGPGIPPEYLNRVFDKFFRVPGGNIHNTKGYGLGLSYASQVMRHHGGSIRVQNLSGGGCRFELHFKL